MDEAGYKTATQFDHRFAMLDLQFGRFPYKFVTSRSRWRHQPRNKLRFF